jgi:hypothetical protein
MTIDQSNVVDFIATHPTKRQVVLVITDHLEWTGDDQTDKYHMYLLQQKMNSYLEFAESGQIYKDYPGAKGKEILIRVMAKFPMSKEASEFFEKVRSRTAEYGYVLEFENPPD